MKPSTSAAADAGDVGVVFVQGAGEEVLTAAVGLGDEIEVIGVRGLEHGADGGLPRVADRAWRQSAFQVGVVGRFDLQVGWRELGLPVVVGSGLRTVA